jgi:hypothetical protein
MRTVILITLIFICQSLSAQTPITKTTPVTDSVIYMTLEAIPVNPLFAGSIPSDIAKYALSGGDATRTPEPADTQLVLSAQPADQAEIEKKQIVRGPLVPGSEQKEKITELKRTAIRIDLPK